jgi:hypothetical protein
VHASMTYPVHDSECGHSATMSFGKLQIKWRGANAYVNRTNDDLAFTTNHGLALAFRPQRAAISALGQQSLGKVEPFVKFRQLS